MTTSTTAHRPPLRLPGQAAAPDGPVDLTGSYVVHHALRRDLAAFASAARCTPIDDRRTWARLSRRFELFTTAQHHRHRGEVIDLWPLLGSRADERGRQVLAALAAEHGEIDLIVESCAAGLVRLAARPNEDVRAALVVRLHAAKESLARHLSHEEREATALVQQLVSPEEWRQLQRNTCGARQLPLGTLVCLVPWAMHQLPTSAQQQVCAVAPLVIRVVWRLRRRAFAAREQRTFRYAVG